MKDKILDWGDEIAIYGVIHDEEYKPLAAGKISLLNGRYELSNIAVLEPERNKGYGDFLVRLLVNKAFMSGAECIYTTTSTNTVGFFEKLGFKILNEKSSIQELLNMILFTSSICRKCSKI
jgi:N-acetylglutamate synthase-like GNAT family acetyltransferase